MLWEGRKTMAAGHWLLLASVCEQPQSKSSAGLARDAGTAPLHDSRWSSLNRMCYRPSSGSSTRSGGEPVSGLIISTTSV